MKPSDYVELLADQIVPLQQQETANAKKIDKILRGGDEPRTARESGREKLKLRELSHTSLLALIVEYSAQQIVAEGVSAGAEDMSRMWEPFVMNGLPSRQGALNTAMLSYGEAYGLVLPGERPDTGESQAYMRAFSPKKFGAIYGDIVDDDFPMYAYRVIPQKAGVQAWRIYDEVAEHYLSYENGKYTYIEARPHGMGVCPVVRFTGDADLEGNVQGEPGKYRRDAERHDKTVYDRLLIQNYNSWRTKYAVKLDPDTPQEDRERIKLQLAQDDMLYGEGETEFGTLDQTDLSPMAAAQEADRDLLAAVSQTPVWAFNGGSMVNLAAEALVEAKSGNRQKVWSIQRSMNRPYCTWLRLGALAEGRIEDSRRFDLDVTWADIGSQSLAAAADALGKLATQLGAPVEMLWEMIPGLSHRKVQAWREYAETHPVGDVAIAQALIRQGGPVGTDR